MDDFEDDLAAMDEEARAAAMARHAADIEAQKAAEWQFRRAEEEKRAYIQGQQAKKAALGRHANANPFDVLEHQNAKAPDTVGPPLDFVFSSPMHRAPPPPMASPMSTRQMNREAAEWEAALREDRRIRNREGLWPEAAPASPLPAHPAAMHGHLHAAMPMWEMQRHLHQQEHVRQMQMAQHAAIYEARHRDLSQQPGYQYYRGPNEKSHRQRFQPIGHERWGH